MHIDIVPNRGARPTFLLRESYRRPGQEARLGQPVRVKRRTDRVDACGAAGRDAAARRGLFEVVGSVPHGQVQAVSMAMHRLGFAQLLSIRVQPERDLVCAMVAARILAPHTKLATTRWWHTSTLATHFGVAGADEDAVYGAMDWLLARQAGIEKKLTARHLGAGDVALYDLSSSYFAGCCCPLAKIGCSRGGKRGK